MAIFGKIQIEKIVQENDKTRIDVSQSFISPDEGTIDMIELEPEAGFGFLDVTNTKYLDWAYITAGDQTITLRITTSAPTTTTFTETMTVLTAAEDQLFSDDYELQQHEHDILNYIPKGRNSFKNYHRAAQDRILGYLDEKRIWDCDGNRLTKAAVVNNDEVNDWSKYMVLMFIFEDLSNAIDDIFFEKSQRYRALMEEARNRASIRLDKNADGEITCDEETDLMSLSLTRRPIKNNRKYTI